MWFHRSSCLIADGEMIQAPDARGTDPISFGDKLEEALRARVRAS